MTKRSIEGAGGRTRFCVLLLGCLAAAGCAARSAHRADQTAPILERRGDAPLPRASASDLAWLAGRWTGTAFGGPCEEQWAPPLAGAMVGAFRAAKGGRPWLYELIVLEPDGESLVMRLKHFGPSPAGLAGWEERARSVDFPLLRVEPGRAFFDGLTYQLVDPAHLTAYVRIRSDDGARERVETIRLTRAD